MQYQQELETSSLIYRMFMTNLFIRHQVNEFGRNSRTDSRSASKYTAELRILLDVTVLMKYRHHV